MITNIDREKNLHKNSIKCEWRLTNRIQVIQVIYFDYFLPLGNKTTFVRTICIGTHIGYESGTLSSKVMTKLCQMPYQHFCNKLKIH